MIQLGSENAKKRWFSSLQEILKIQNFQIFSPKFSKFQYFHQNWLEMKNFQWEKSIFEQKICIVKKWFCIDCRIEKKIEFFFTPSIDAKSLFDATFFCSKIDFFHWKFFISSQFWWKYWNFGNFGEKIWKFSIFKISYNDENQRFLAFTEPNWIVLVPCRFRIF